MPEKLNVLYEGVACAYHRQSVIESDGLFLLVSSVSNGFLSCDCAFARLAALDGTIVLGLQPPI